MDRRRVKTLYGVILTMFTAAVKSVGLGLEKRGKRTATLTEGTLWIRCKK